MKALVTGGAGFIGSHLVRKLQDQGWDVVVLDDLSNGLADNVPAGVQLVVGDACDEAVLAALPDDFSAVFHLAAVASVQDSLARPSRAHHRNLTSTLGLLELCRERGIRRFVFSSSAAVYGDAGSCAIREDFPKAPLSHYAVQKLASEYYCDVYRRLHGLETVCLRYFNVFGPRQRGDSPYSGVITKFLSAARQGLPLTIFGDGSQSRDFVPVAGVVEANIAAATSDPGAISSGGGVFNIGSGRSRSVLELADMVRELFPSMPPHVHRPAQSGEIMHSRSDVSLAARNLGYRPRQDFAEALAELAEAPV